MFIILGLGNPGLEYEDTRHNLGFMVVDSLAQKYNIRFTESIWSCVYGDGEIKNVPVRIGKPMTYMNESGMAAKAILSFTGKSPNHLIVAHDEIDLLFGKIKVKHKGGDAGQRGIRSIINHLDDNRFTRIRVGVGRPEGNRDVVDYLLSPFEKKKWPEVENILERAVESIETTLEDLNRKINNSEEEKEC